MSLQQMVKKSLYNNSKEIKKIAIGLLHHKQRRLLMDVVFYGIPYGIFLDNFQMYQIINQTGSSY